ncbi:MAG: hypothetical protein ACYS22_04570 [Planctomycetota bacterium]|jgi:hypothetical protein
MNKPTRPASPSRKRFLGLALVALVFPVLAATSGCAVGVRGPRAGIRVGPPVVVKAGHGHHGHHNHHKSVKVTRVTVRR